MGELGIIGPEERVELLDGEIITMPPMSPEHAWSVRAVTAALYRAVGGRASIGPQVVITLDPISEPQPDVMLNALPDERYWRAHPTAEETFLVVEVSKSTLAFDRGKKLRAYARCRVREYWVVDVVNEQVEVYLNPREERYTKHLTFRRGETLAPKAFPDALVRVDEIFPPRAKM